MTVTLLTDDRVERIVGALLQGGSKRSAATAAGVDAYTLYDWLRKGRRDLALGRFGTPYIKLLHEVEKAEGDAELEAVSTIRALGRGGIVSVPVLDELRRPVRNKRGEVQTELVYERPRWEALAWFLERRFPGEWSRQSTLNVATQDFGRQELSDEQTLDLFSAGVDLLNRAKEAQQLRQERTVQLIDGPSKRTS